MIERTETKRKVGGKQWMELGVQSTKVKKWNKTDFKPFPGVLNLKNL